MRSHGLTAVPQGMAVSLLYVLTGAKREGTAVLFVGVFETYQHVEKHRKQEK